MSLVRKLASCSIVLAAFMTVPVAVAQDQPTQEQMEAWQKSMTPGAEHASLAKSAGTWKAEMTDHTMGDVKSEGTATAEMTMGGRYLVMKIKSTIMGMPFEGVSTTGYDNTKKMFISTWYDNMGTGIMVSEGKMTGPKTREFIGKMLDPMSGKEIQSRQVETHEDDKHMTFEMYMPGPDGKEMKAITIQYTRA